MKKEKNIVYFMYIIANIISFIHGNNITITNQLIGYFLDFSKLNFNLLFFCSPNVCRQNGISMCCKGWTRKPNEPYCNIRKIRNIMKKSQFALK